VLAEFDREAWALKTAGLAPAALADTIATSLASAETDSSHLADRLPEVRRQSGAQFERLFRVLAERRGAIAPAPVVSSAA
jgi:hypothetical protein